MYSLASQVIHLVPIPNSGKFHLSRYSPSTLSGAVRFQNSRTPYIQIYVLHSELLFFAGGKERRFTLQGMNQAYTLTVLKCVFRSLLENFVCRLLKRRTRTAINAIIQWEPNPNFSWNSLLIWCWNKEHLCCFSGENKSSCGLQMHSAHNSGHVLSENRKVDTLIFHYWNR